MKLAFSKKLNQVKVQKLQQSTLSELFRKLKLNQFLKELGFIKKRGISTTELLHVYFLTIIEKGQSINGALQTLCLAKYKTPLNDFINNYNRKWCRLLSRVSRMSMSLHSGNIQDNKIIIDDTKKEKSGKKADFVAWFFDHSEQKYYYGFQNIVMAFYNGVVSIPLDFKFKIGRKRLQKNKEQREIPVGSETWKELYKLSGKWKNRVNPLVN